MKYEIDQLIAHNIPPCKPVPGTRLETKGVVSETYEADNGELWRVTYAAKSDGSGVTFTALKIQAGRSPV